MQPIAGFFTNIFAMCHFILNLLIHISQMKTARDVTIYDVAKALNISPSTVSRGLKDHPHIHADTRKRIKAMAREMGYQQNKFASSLRKRSTETIGVVVPKLNSYFMATVIAGMEEITNQNGYGLIISQSQEAGKKETGCVSTLFHSRVDGLLVSLAYDTENIDHFNQILRKNIPVVFFDRVANCPGCMGIVIDNFRAGYEVTSHLISQGCRRIMHVSGNLLRNVYSGRFEGYRQALADNGIAFDNELLMVSELSSQAGSEAAQAVLRMKDRPDGIFAANDTSAVAVICELQKSGIRIPADIAVAGFNNEPVSRVIKPCLTTVDYPAREIGRLAASSLINILNNKGTSSLSTIIVKHELIVRESTLRKKPQASKKHEAGNQ